MDSRHRSTSRMRRLARGVLGVVTMLGVAAVISPAQRAAALAPPLQSDRPIYHLTAPDNWLSDPQRPVYANGKYNLYYLYSDRTNATGEGGWRHATTTDNVVFTDKGVAIPWRRDFPVWTGSSVVDTNNTAGFGAGAVIALATQPPSMSGGYDANSQQQYLWYSTDGGNTFTPYGPPVISHPSGVGDFFRDPKIAWDPAHSEWVAAVGMSHQIRLFTSPDLKSWTQQSDFTAFPSGLVNGYECPDLFQIRADDGSTHWVLAGSVEGDYSSAPSTYAYWTGNWNGTSFTADDAAHPQFLDYGYDWYAGVTWPDAASPLDTRYGIAWQNNWKYALANPQHFPSDVSDNVNGQMSVVRQISMTANGNGSYTLLSQPVSTLNDIATRAVSVPTTTVNGTTDLDYHGSAYELDTDVSWQSLNNVGISVGVNGDHSRYTNIGVYQGNVYVDRRHSDRPGESPDLSLASWPQTNAPIDPSATSVHLRVLVDRTSVEVFVDDGRTVMSNLVFFKPGDTGIQFYTDGGSATFANTTITELGNTTLAASSTAPYEGFEGSNYGSWATTGTAFGSGPASGTLANQQPVSGYTGSRLVNSYNSGDSTTGTLVSPNFTIDAPLIDLQVGGGHHPRPADLYDDFESSSWTPWTATGSFSGQGPTSESLPNQVGAKVLDTFVNGGDAATGTITSPTFTITRGYVDLLLAGGDHPAGASGETTVNLLVDGATVYRSATGDNSATMRAVSWDVHDLIGHSASIQVVDNATGAWGHLMVDQILFADDPAATAGGADTETAVNLVVNGQVVRTATGQDSEHLTSVSWPVSDLHGQTAHLEIVDNNTGGWGHILADQVTFDALPAAAHAGPITWNGSSGYCIDRDNASGHVQLYTCNGLWNQNWAMHPDHTITSEGACLELPAGQTANNTLVNVGPCTGTANQVWTVNGTQLENAAANRCLDLPNGNTGLNPPTQLQVYDCGAGANQTWNVPTS